MRRITLLTDFGTRDGYVGAMKGVLATLAPDATIEDASHEIAPGDVAGAAWALAAYWRRFPPATVHVAVVDPGVGGARRALAALVDGRYFVAPDNGILGRVFERAEPAAIVEIRLGEDAAERISSTFHGRDVFAPAAARLANGEPIDGLGPAVDDPVRLPLPEPVSRGSVLEGEVVHVDRFGNLITNVPGAWLRAGARVLVAGAPPVPLRRTYSEARAGEVLAVVGSADLVEVAVREGSAAERLDAGRGARIRIELPPAGAG